MFSDVKFLWPERLVKEPVDTILENRLLSSDKIELVGPDKAAVQAFRRSSADIELYRRRGGNLHLQRWFGRYGQRFGRWQRGRFLTELHTGLEKRNRRLGAGISLCTAAEAASRRNAPQRT